ncbi:NUDIX domain-containing protein [Acinetobacter sp. VNH17]|uniref:NUDIX domain-containing protein n=1 Tax=Acinetobacter thutiue TaxID=2998078 RepID=A0ABT7WL60_9GAMM|nr:NUDIX domain-containing protein [Acinetobacter thutiue]MCY6411321.1 NUDIX domain-containing protein [Acinetobacter thutiue]MDN0013423.1 NUDIX domain-containing protein [Acinetobacter thutiue]
MKDLTLEVAEGKLNIRVAAWIEHEDQILVSTFPDGSISLVGGRLRFSETTLDGIRREVFEETGEHFNSPVLFAIVENFFYDIASEQQFHEFLYIYKGEIQQKSAYLETNSTAVEVISWMPKSKIKMLKPDVLQELVLLPRESVVHLVNMESR